MCRCASLSVPLDNTDYKLVQTGIRLLSHELVLKTAKLSESDSVTI